jgi:hypothetical protein
VPETTKGVLFSVMDQDQIMQKEGKGVRIRLDSMEGQRGCSKMEKNREGN